MVNPDLESDAILNPDVRAKDVKNTSFAKTIRELRIVILLLVNIAIWVVFNFLTDGVVLTARNLSILSVQMSVTAIIAIGMTLLLIAKEIDLSAGAAMALIIVVIFQLQVTHQISTPVTLLVAIGCGGFVGMLSGLLRVTLLIPSFIITLAGFSWLRGLAFIVADAQTLAGASESFYVLANNYIPVRVSALIIVLIAVIYTVQLARPVLATDTKLKISRAVDICRLLTLLVFVIGAYLTFTSYRGLPFPTFLVIVIALFIQWMLSSTDLGRHVYAVGGNEAAAKRVGINVKQVTVILFVIMGMLVAVAAIVQGSLLDAAPPAIGDLIALNAISAAIIGGTNLFGGHGSITGTVAGSMLMASIANGLSLIGVNSFKQMIATGLILLVAVAIDALGAPRRVR